MIFLSLYSKDQDWFKKNCVNEHDMYDKDGFDSYGYDEDDRDRAGVLEDDYMFDDEKFEQVTCDYRNKPAPVYEGEIGWQS